MTLKKTLENSVSIDYAVKCLAQHLQITVQEAPQLPSRGIGERVKELPYVAVGTVIDVVEKVDRLFNREARRYYREHQETLKYLLAAREEDNRRFFAQYGAETQQEKDICEVLYTTGLSLKRLLRNKQKNKEGINLHARGFNETLNNVVADGVRVLNSKYGGLAAVDSYFQKKAVTWLKEEVDRRITAGTVEFLDVVTLKQREAGHYLIMELEEKEN